MLFYVLLFVIFLLAAQFAISMLPFLLPLFLIFFVISLFKRPNVKVYTHTFTYPEGSYPGSASSSRTTSEPPRLVTRAPLEGSIDAEFTQHYTEETGE